MAISYPEAIKVFGSKNRGTITTRANTVRVYTQAGLRPDQPAVFIIPPSLNGILLSSVKLVMKSKIVNVDGTNLAIVRRKRNPPAESYVDNGSTSEKRRQTIGEKMKRFTEKEKTADETGGNNQGEIVPDQDEVETLVHRLAFKTNFGSQTRAFLSPLLLGLALYFRAEAAYNESRAAAEKAKEYIRV